MYLQIYNIKYSTKVINNNKTLLSLQINVKGGGEAITLKELVSNLIEKQTLFIKKRI